MRDIIRNSAVPSHAKLRIVILFALRYQKSKANDISNLIQLMLENGVLREDAKVSSVIKFVLTHCFETLSYSLSTRY